MSTNATAQQIARLTSLLADIEAYPDQQAYCAVIRGHLDRGLDIKRARLLIYNLADLAAGCEDHARLIAEHARQEADRMQRDACALSDHHGYHPRHG